jgi:hypothetical protein
MFKVAFQSICGIDSCHWKGGPCVFSGLYRWRWRIWPGLAFSELVDTQE